MLLCQYALKTMENLINLLFTCFKTQNKVTVTQMIAKTTCIQSFTWYLVVLITQIVSVLLCNMLEGVPLFLIKIL